MMTENGHTEEEEEEEEEALDSVTWKVASRTGRKIAPGARRGESTKYQLGSEEKEGERVIGEGMHLRRRSALISMPDRNKLRFVN